MRFILREIEMAELIFKGKDEFLKQKKEQRSQTDLTAQQLVNIYRQLNILGGEATQKYNQQLIREANSDVLAALHSIPGGDEVRDYYTFLTRTQMDEDSSFSSGDVTNGLLPAPEEISPIWETLGMGGGVSSQKPIAMEVVNPIRASVVATSLAGAIPASKGNVSYQSNVDFKSLHSEMTNAFETKKNQIMQALNFIVIDSNIEKMHQNLKGAISQVLRSLDELKTGLNKTVADAKEKAVFVDVMEKQPETIQKPLEDTSVLLKSDVEERISLEKFRKPKIQPKFSVDIDEEEENF